MTTIGKVMQEPVFVDRHTTVKDAVAKMVAHDVCCVIVGDSEEHQGVVSERMILDAIAEDGRVLSAPVSELVRYQPACIGKGKTIKDAAKLMVEKRIRHLCVEDDDKIIGCLDSRTVMANI